MKRFHIVTVSPATDQDMTAELNRKLAAVVTAGAEAFLDCAFAEPADPGYRPAIVFVFIETEPRQKPAAGRG